MQNLFFSFKWCQHSCRRWNSDQCVREAARGTGLNIDYLMLNCNPEMLKQQVCKTVFSKWRLRPKWLLFLLRNGLNLKLTSFALQDSSWGMNLLVIFYVWGSFWWFFWWFFVCFVCVCLFCFVGFGGLFWVFVGLGFHLFGLVFLLFFPPFFFQLHLPPAFAIWVCSAHSICHGPNWVFTSVEDQRWVQALLFSREVL